MTGRSSMMLLSLLAGLGGPVAAEEWRPGLTLFGTPGLVEMPTASALPDAEIAMTLGGFQTHQRLSFTFQATPRLTGTFRYSRIDEYTGPGTNETFDRSFDFQYLLVEEGTSRPAVAIGLRDFMGTGLYTSEYVVATKALSPTLRVSGGLGWGRLGSRNGFDNPLGVLSDGFETRPGRDVSTGGTPSFNQFFRGDAAFFGGVEWRISPELTATAEYSSDAYVRETGLGVIDRPSPLNFGLRYAPRPGYELGAYYLGGEEISVSATFLMNPTRRAAPSGLEGAPLPVAVRAEGLREAQSWDRSALPEERLIEATTQILALDGFVVEGMSVSDRFVTVRYTNETYRAEAQGLGRVARVLTQTMPPSVETFVLQPSRAGIPLSSVTLARSDLEALENEPDAAWRSLARAQIGEVDREAALASVASSSPAFEWGLSPYLALQLFDGDNPVRTEYGLQGRLRYELRPNLVLTGAARYALSGNRSKGAISPSTLHPVRRNVGLYGSENALGLQDLALHWYSRPGEALYSRVSVGYLEPMFAGVSGELLWKPVDSRLALGAELNLVAQRDYDLGFGLRSFTAADDTEVTGIYQTTSGHVSAYYDFENGFNGRLDLGRYLAGDWGATVTLTREFANGWEVGAYATFTNVPFEDFGEGSFDKGILVTIPIDWALGTATRNETAINLSSLSRDGGARINVQGRLYDVVRDGHSVELAESWGRFWR